MDPKFGGSMSFRYFKLVKGDKISNPLPEIHKPSKKWRSRFQNILERTQIFSSSNMGWQGQAILLLKPTGRWREHILCYLTFGRNCIRMVAQHRFRYPIR